MVKIILKKTGRGFIFKKAASQQIAQIKVNKSIEILKVPISKRSKVFNDNIGFDVDEKLIQKILIMRYKKVSITTIKSKKDLERLLFRKPDLVFSGVKFFEFKKEKIWLNDFLKKFNIAHITSSAEDLENESNKSIAKDIIRKAKIKTASSVIVDGNTITKSFRLPMPFPVFVKPIIGGDSKGVDHQSVVKDLVSLKKKINDIKKKYHCASIVETYLDGKEYTVGIMQDSATGHLTALPAEIIIEKNSKGQRILDFKTKKENTEELVSIPDIKLFNSLSDMARKSFIALKGRSIGRIDIRMDENYTPHFIEANLMPGLRTGYFYRCCNLNLNINYQEMILRIANNGLMLHRI
jgi:D-alanine-D-alanine ligase